MQVKDTSNSNKTSRKYLIIEAAVRCFIENGYNQTGMRDIAKKAGISLGNIYNHFSGKDALLMEIAAIESDELHELIEILSHRDDPQNAMSNFVKAYLNYTSRPENALLGQEILGEAVRNPVIEEIFSANRAMLVTALSELLEAGRKLGIYRNFSNQQEPSEIILDLIEGKALRGVLKGTSVTGQSDHSEVLVFINNALIA